MSLTTFQSYEFEENLNYSMLMSSGELEKKSLGGCLFYKHPPNPPWNIALGGVDLKNRIFLNFINAFHFY